MGKDAETIRLGYERKMTLLSAALQSDELAFVPLAKLQDDQFAAYLCASGSKGADTAAAGRFRQHYAQLEVEDGRYFKFYVQRRGEPGYVASATIYFSPDMPDAPAIGCTVLPEHRRFGLGTAIVTQIFNGLCDKAYALGIRSVRAEVFPVDNKASHAMIKKSGFQEAGSQLSSYTTNVDGTDLPVKGQVVPNYVRPVKRVRGTREK